jgi:hypothetical protein
MFAVQQPLREDHTHMLVIQGIENMPPLLAITDKPHLAKKA